VHSLDFWLTSEDLPDPDNRVTLDRSGSVVLSYRPNNETGHARLIAKLKDAMKRQTRCGVHGHDCHVVDASFFPSSAAVNPALTIMANALRVGDHLARRLG
jgi:hypothetical protein